jgi:hypothetical protein
MHLVVKLDIHGFMFVIHHLEGVGTKPMHVAVPIRNASIGEGDHCLVGCFWSQGNEVPEHVGILQNFQHFVDGYNSVQSVECQPTFRRNISLLSSGSKNKSRKKPA